MQLRFYLGLYPPCVPETDENVAIKVSILLEKLNNFGEENFIDQSILTVLTIRLLEGVIPADAMTRALNKNRGLTCGN